METEIRIKREYRPNQTIGQGRIIDFGVELYRFKTVELPWKNNKVRESCIPEGEYQAIKHHSPKFKNCFWIQNVPGRSEILIHAANYTYQLLGCIAPGKIHTDMDGDGLVDVTHSRDTITDIWARVPDELKVVIE